MKVDQRALYQKHRPRKFSEIFGQESICRILKNSIETNRIHNAYVFQGFHGTGKTSTARIFAAAMNCPNFKETHDLDIENKECRACQSVFEGHSDIFEFDAASNSSVDDIRRLREELELSPFEFKRKVYIIDEAHMLSNAAWDALLKVLEQEDLGAVFIFATTNSKKIPKTIMSRCIDLRFQNLSKDLMGHWIKNILDKEEIKYEEPVIDMILTLANGSFRDSLTIVDKWILLNASHKITEETLAESAEVPTLKEVKKWLKKLVDKKMDKALDDLKKFLLNGVDPINLARIAVSEAKKTLRSKLGNQMGFHWSKLVMVFYEFLKDQRVFFNPDISLEILLLDFLTKDVEFHDRFIVESEGKKESVGITKNSQEDSSNAVSEIDSTIDDEIEQTLELSDDTLDLTFDDIDEKDSDSKEVKVAKAFQNIEYNSKVVTLAWETILNMYEKKNEGVFPKSWNIDRVRILPLIYETSLTRESKIQEAEKAWKGLELFLEENSMLPYSALLYDAVIEAISDRVLFITYNSPLRAILINKMSRTGEFMSLIRKIFGRELWVIALSKPEWRDITKLYDENQLSKKYNIKEMQVPETPPIINKTLRMARKTKEEILLKIEAIPELKDYVIRKK